MRDRFTAISEHKHTKSVIGKTGTPPENDREGNQEGFREGPTGNVSSSCLRQENRGDPCRSATPFKFLSWFSFRIPSWSFSGFVLLNEQT
jgi:hypothetical protein